MTSILVLKGIGKKKSDDFLKLGVKSVEELAVAKGLPTPLDKFKQLAIEYLKTVREGAQQHPIVSTPEISVVSECQSYCFDKHTWLNRVVQIPSGKDNAIRKAVIIEILLEHGERLVVLCRDVLTKVTTSWQIPTLTVLNFELPPLRLSMSQEDMDAIPCLEYVLSTLWQSDYIRSCMQTEP